MQGSDYLSSGEIIRRLSEPSDDPRLMRQQILQEASNTDLVRALQQSSDPYIKEILCDLVGTRFEQGAVPVLVELLQDPSERVRGAAADALGKIGDPRAGPHLYHRFAGAEQDRGVRHLLAASLGAVEYRPAIPLLMRTLGDEDPVLRGCSAWALGIMVALEAEDTLHDALARETEPAGSYVHDRLKESADALGLSKRALGMSKRNEAAAILLAAIAEDTWIGVRTAAAAWALGELRASEARGTLAALLQKYPQGFLARRLSSALRQIG